MEFEASETRSTDGALKGMTTLNHIYETGYMDLSMMTGTGRIHQSFGVFFIHADVA